jgi:hypothetical protein
MTIFSVDGAVKRLRCIFLLMTRAASLVTQRSGGASAKVLRELRFVIRPCQISKLNDTWRTHWLSQNFSCGFWWRADTVPLRAEGDQAHAEQRVACLHWRVLRDKYTLTLTGISQVSATVRLRKFGE